MLLENFLSDETVLVGLRENDYTDVIRRLVKVLEKAGHLRDPGKALEAVLQREELGTTFVGKGLGLPHARTEAVDDVTMAFATTKEGIKGEPPDGVPVRVVALILAPRTESTLYIKLLSAVSRLVGDSDRRRGIVEAKDKEGLFAQIVEAGIEVERGLSVSDVARDAVVVGEDASLKEAADVMFKHNLLDVPVADREGHLVGVLTAEDLLRVGVPDYLMRLESVAFLKRFEPFEELLRKEESLLVHQVMSEAVKVEEDAPLIQAAVLMARRDVRTIIVTKKDKPVGLVTLGDFIRKVLRA